MSSDIEKYGDKVVIPPVTWLMAQSVDAGVTVTFMPACDIHAESWWDDQGDWNGSHLDQTYVGPLMYCSLFHG